MGQLLVQQQITTQRQLFHSRREALNATLASIKTEVAGQEASIEGLKNVLIQRGLQLQLLRQELEGITDLVKEGYVARSKKSELERGEADLSASIADSRARLEQTKRMIDELAQKANLRQQEYRKEVEGQLAEVRREVQADAEKLAAAKEELGRMDLRAPATGQVVGLAIQTVGAVVQPAEKLMDIVPNEAHLLLEAQIPPHLSDRVQLGMMADIRFSAFAHSPQLVVDGRLKSMSQDLLTDPETRMSYYLARLEITPEGMERLGHRKIVPGMPAEVVIKTGERSLLTYLLHPLLRRVAQSMTEE
jgi:protease secretion system membrane fusion protein